MLELRTQSLEGAQRVPTSPSLSAATPNNIGAHMRRSTTFQIASLCLIVALFAVSHHVMGEAFRSDEPVPHRVATVDLLGLLEDALQTDEYKPERDEYRDAWEDRILDVQNRLEQIENELRMASPSDPNARMLQQRYQQTGFEFQQMQRQASMEFDRFSANQAAEAYADLHGAASALAHELGYSHVVATRRSGEIADRGNLATVTQEILARVMVVSPEADDLTARLREKLGIPERERAAAGRPEAEDPEEEAGPRADWED